MPNTWIERLKIFNDGVNVWAIPRKNTPERVILDAKQKFGYTLPPTKKEEPKPTKNSKVMK
jgi:hypothetical protein